MLDFVIEIPDGCDVDILAVRCDVRITPAGSAVQMPVAIAGAASQAFGDVELDNIEADIELITEAA